MGGGESDKSDGAAVESKEHHTKTRRRTIFTIYKMASTSLLCTMIILMSFFCVNLLALMLQWLHEGRQFYTMRQVNRAIYEYYNQKFYLWYLMIRNWDCHEDGKIKVIIPNYLAS